MVENITYNSHFEIRGPQGEVVYVRKSLWNFMEDAVQKHNARRGPGALDRQMNIGDVLNDALAAGLFGPSKARQMRAELEAAADSEYETRRDIAERDRERAAEMEQQRLRRLHDKDAQALRRVVKRGPQPTVQRVADFLKRASAVGIGIDEALLAAGIDRESAGAARFVDAALRVYDRENEPVGG